MHFYFLLLLLNVVLGDSSEFTLKLSAPGTALDNGFIYWDSDVFYLAKSANTKGDITTKILTNGSLVIISDSNTVAGISKNYFSTKAFSSTYTIAYPWTISSGHLKYDGNDFHAVPSGHDDGSYVLGSINAAAGRDTVFEISILAIGDDGQTLGDYDSNDDAISSSTSISSSSISSSSASIDDVTSSTGSALSSKATISSTSYPASSGAISSFSSFTSSGDSSVLSASSGDSTSYNGSSSFSTSMISSTYSTISSFNESSSTGASSSTGDRSSSGVPTVIEADGAALIQGSILGSFVIGLMLLW